MLIDVPAPLLFYLMRDLLTRIKLYSKNAPSNKSIISWHNDDGLQLFHQIWYAAMNCIDLIFSALFDRGKVAHRTVDITLFKRLTVSRKRENEICT